MMRALTVALLSLATVAGAAAAPASLDTLAWLAGSWASDSAGVRSEEHWTAPRGGLMLGVHRDLAGGRAAAFEFLRIVADSGGIAYLAQPGGRSPTRFAMAEAGPRRVMFANPAHDFPQRILYWLDRDGALHARVEGTMGGRAVSQQWRWRPARLDR